MPSIEALEAAQCADPENAVGAHGQCAHPVVGEPVRYIERCRTVTLDLDQAGFGAHPDAAVPAFRERPHEGVLQRSDGDRSKVSMLDHRHPGPGTDPQPACAIDE